MADSGSGADFGSSCGANSASRPAMMYGQTIGRATTRQACARARDRQGAQRGPERRCGRRRPGGLARGKQYDVALVDASLHDMDAWALLARLRAGRRPIPHLALTKAARSMSERLKAWKGSTALLQDPPDPEQLDAWLSRIELGPAG